MSRLIDADEAIDYVNDLITVHRFYHPRSTTENFPISEVIAKINEVPTVDAVPVGRCDECKKILLDKNVTATFPIADYAPVVHGHWINSGYACGETDWECSVCHCHEWRTGKTEYCMRCGAIMDEVAES